MSEFIPYGLHSIDDKDVEEVVKVLKSDWITTGPKIKEFEDSICNYVGCNSAVAVCNGTAALDIAVQSLDLPAGSEVITTPFTFVASSNCILYNNCKPVFVDIKKDTYNIDPEKIEEKITEKTKAILYVDYAGQPCDIDKLKEIADRHNLFLIEDACHAIGAEYKGKKVGNLADLTVFSFHPVKQMTTGEGGLIATNNEELYKRLLMLRNHGMDKDAKDRFGPNSGWAYDIKLLGRNYRITDFQCVLGISQLKKLDAFIKRREEIVNKYNEAFKGVKEITTPFIKKDIRHALHLYVVLLDEKIDRNSFFDSMRQANIGVNVHYAPIYHFSYYKEHFNPGDFPVTEGVFNKIITLPLHPSMSNEDVEYVISSVKNLLRKNTR